MPNKTPASVLHVGRRQFVEGLVLGGLTATPLVSVASTRGATQSESTLSETRPLQLKPTSTTTLHGPEINLRIGHATVNFTGKSRTATVINGQLPAPILRWREGDTVKIRVYNDLDEDTSIHWHGILLPANMDGVPGFSFHGIAPGEFYDYEFTLKQSGTYWYHAHSSMQEQTGVYGAIVVDPKVGSLDDFDRDHVILLSDWTDEDPQRIFRKLKKQADYYNHHQRTVKDFVRDVRTLGFSAALADRKAWGEMRMSPTDFADVNGNTYIFLTNGITPNGNWSGLFKPEERVRLRFINGSGMSYFDVRIPGLAMTVVASDGQPVEPVEVDEFRIGVAETYDVIVTPRDDRAYTIFAQNLDRTGYARATLAPRVGMWAEIPKLDRPVFLSMQDMGHGGMEGGCGASMKHAPASNGAGEMTCGTSMQSSSKSSNTTEMSCGAAMKSASKKAPPEMACGASMGEESCGASMSNSTTKTSIESSSPMAMINHPSIETGHPGVDMQTMMPTRALDDPGVGLRATQLKAVRDDWHAQHRVLSYAQLRSRFADPDPRPPSRTIELHLTGHMERYVWSMNAEKFSGAEPIRLRYGERVRFVLVNDTMMAHPIHLHGLWSDLEDESGAFLVRKHTVNVPPGSIRSYRVSADALGRWAYHCHLLLHMEAGMFREVIVE